MGALRQLRQLRLTRASEVAWAVERVAEVAILGRASGWCLGLLHSHEVILRAEGASRASRGGVGARVRSVWHAHRGHDPWCLALGVPQVTLYRLLRECAVADHAAYVLDASRAAVAEISLLQHWKLTEAIELFRYHLHSRITPQRPSALRESRGPFA